jgi:hypothetical protein
MEKPVASVEVQSQKENEKSPQPAEARKKIIPRQREVACKEGKRLILRADRRKRALSLSLSVSADLLRNFLAYF